MAQLRISQCPPWIQTTKNRVLIKKCLFRGTFYTCRASLVAQMVKHLPVKQETWVQSLGQEDPLEKEMATHSSTAAWKIPWMEETGRLQSMGSQRIGHDWATSLVHWFDTCKYARNISYSCIQKPRWESVMCLLLKKKKKLSLEDPEHLSWTSLTQRKMQWNRDSFALRRPWWWERMKATGEEGSRGWDGKIASPTQWTWIWANSGR